MSIKSYLKLSGLKISKVGLIGIYEVEELTTLRAVVEFAGPTNEIVFKGKIKGQSKYEEIAVITGNGNIVIPVYSYDSFSIECSKVDAIENSFRFSVSGFSFIVGAEINDGSVDTDSTWSSSKITNTLAGLGDRNVRVTRFAPISSGTNGRITIPYEQTVILDDFGGTVDAIVTTISNGRPTYNSAQNIQGEVIATTFDARGNYSFTSTPSSYPVAIIYRVRQKVSTYLDSEDNVLGSVQFQEVSSVNGKTGSVVLDKSDIGLFNVDNTSDLDKPISNATQLALNTKYDNSNPAQYINQAQAILAAPVQSVAGKVGEILLNKFDVGLSNVDNTSDLDKIISTQTQAALNNKLNVPLNITITSQHLLDKYITLTNIPVNPASVILIPHGGVPQINGQDFEVVGDQLRWEGKGLEEFLEIGDDLLIIY